MKRIETERESKSAQDEAKQFEAEKKLANDRQKKMEICIFGIFFKHFLKTIKNTDLFGTFLEGLFSRTPVSYCGIM